MKRNQHKKLKLGMNFLSFLNKYKGAPLCAVVVLLSCILTLIIYPVIGLELYFLFSYIIPFGDLKDIVKQYNDIAVHSLKMEVVKDRLEAMNDKRRY